MYFTEVEDSSCNNLRTIPLACKINFQKKTKQFAVFLWSYCRKKLEYTVKTNNMCNMVITVSVANTRNQTQAPMMRGQSVNWLGSQTAH